MKKFTFFTFIFLSFSFLGNAQFKDLLKKTGNKDSSKTSLGNVLGNITTKSTSALTNDEIIGGLKEALVKGTENGTKKLSATDGFFKDAVLKILMPEEALKVEKTLRNFGMGKQVDNAILSMNRAAEDAAKSAAPIFIKAVKEMSVQDALGILRGSDHAATDYLLNKTSEALTASFRPVIETSLEKTNATKHWNTVFTSYNKFSKDPVNTDLAAYVTERALAGIFHMVAAEEQKIRKDPMARTSDLLKKVFAN